MTEEQWLTSTDPLAMLTYLRCNGGVTDRKLRQFAIACCRQCWHLLRDWPVRQGVEIAERMVARCGNETEVVAARRELERAATWGSHGQGVGPLWCAGWFTDPFYGAWDNSLDPDAPAVLALAAILENAQDGAEMCIHWATALGLEDREQAAILRDVMHPPYRKVLIRASWRQWGGGTIIQLAKAIYDSQGFDNLPILADALEEAGCIEFDLLAHCRYPARHVRGCWALDAVLAKW